jgi:hypothetical protein
MHTITSLDIAIQGMRESLASLEDPALTQRSAFTHFSSFVARSSQARNMFIREYLHRTGKKKAGKKWAGEIWKARLPDAKVAELFHKLRNHDVHTAAFRVLPEEETVFGVPVGGETFQLKIGGGRIEVTDPALLFSEEPGPRLGIYLKNASGTEDRAEVVSYSCRFVVACDDPQVQNCLEAVGTADVVQLAQRHLRLLELYQPWFDEQFPPKK